MNTPKVKIEASAIRHSGMGGFLNPPTHPEHTLSVEIDLKRKPENRGSMSLSAALGADYISPSMKSRIADIFAKWEENKPSIDSPEIKDWIAHVLGYFKGCYQGVNGSWNAGELVISKEIDPIANQDKHAGVHLIKAYYPDFIATAEDFKNAYWGSK